MRGDLFWIRVSPLKGKIAKGMLADFIVLSDDIDEISSKDLLDLKVEQTYVSGQLKYEIK